jgi:hypothetical protein
MRVADDVVRRMRERTNRRIVNISSAVIGGGRGLLWHHVPASMASSGPIGPGPPSSPPSTSTMAQDITDAVRFLSSDIARVSTGRVLHVGFGEATR